ncbi:unnamed protein product, partial [Rotaria magnacalcarata]
MSLTQMLRVNADASLNWVNALPDAVRCYNSTYHRSINSSPINFLLKKQHVVNNKNIMRDKDIQYWGLGNPGFKSFVKGSLVMKIIPRQGNSVAFKLQHIYAGPYEVTHVYPGGIAYDIQSIQDYGCVTKVHFSQLRAWHTPSSVLMRNPDYRAYYNITKPLTPLEETYWLEGYDDPLLGRNKYKLNWRPKDIDCPDDRCLLQTDDEESEDESYNDHPRINHPAITRTIPWVFAHQSYLGKLPMAHSASVNENNDTTNHDMNNINNYPSQEEASKPRPLSAAEEGLPGPIGSPPVDPNEQYRHLISEGFNNSTCEDERVEEILEFDPRNQIYNQPQINNYNNE